MSYYSRLVASNTYSMYSLRPQAPEEQEQHPRVLYDMLMAYYKNNGLYDDLAIMLYEQGVRREALKGLRNPAYRVVEFYASHLWPGMLPDALPVVSDNKRIVDPIKQIWKWSNWNANKQQAARWFPTHGDKFIKIAQRVSRQRTAQRVYMQLLDPGHITDFDEDERGFITYARIDVPQTKRDGGKVTRYTLTEVWDKESGTFTRWEHNKSADDDLERLGIPTERRELAEFGIDFIPIVHARFRHIGEDRGVGAYTLQLDKIDEANRMATRLHQMLYRNNDALWALRANAMDSTGRPLPAPRVGNQTGDGRDGDTIQLGDQRLLRLPGMSELVPLVPDINYDAALRILQDHMMELENDLPELAYYRIREMNEVSGRAVRLLLSDAIDKLIEARGNAEGALAQAHAMALTIGANAGLFKNLGTYEQGAFEHKFAERAIIPISADEKATTTLTLTNAGASIEAAAIEAGFTEDSASRLARGDAVDGIEP